MKPVAAAAAAEAAAAPEAAAAAEAAAVAEAAEAAVAALAAEAAELALASEAAEAAELALALAAEAAARRGELAAFARPDHPLTLKMHVVVAGFDEVDPAIPCLLCGPAGVHPQAGPAEQVCNRLRNTGARAVRGNSSDRRCALHRRTGVAAKVRVLTS
jgi:hypothetical protein